MKESDIIVIGGGAAGMTAALYSLRNGKTVTVFENESIGGQIATSPRVENFPTHKQISGMELSDMLFDQIQNLGADFEFEKVEKIEKLSEGKFVVTSEYKNEFFAKSVIIATGVKHKHINLENEDKFNGHGISYCAVCDGDFYKNRDVALIGDGNTALQYALLLSNYCTKVYICTWFDKFFGDDALVKALLKTPNIEWIQNVSTKSLNGTDKLESITLNHKLDGTDEILKVEGCFIAIGQIPDNTKFKNLVELDELGYIIADETGKTKTPGLFCAGDCRRKAVRQVTTACSDGANCAVAASTYISTLE
ncbi:MAG: FAD-dependent oxidoreductase [Clostridia bacterium]|nr:FAD-dependent oxidoreductase [Clostridia bacterium]